MTLIKNLLGNKVVKVALYVVGFSAVSWLVGPMIKTWIESQPWYTPVGGIIIAILIIVALIRLGVHHEAFNK